MIKAAHNWAIDGELLPSSLKSMWWTWVARRHALANIVELASGRR